MTSIHISEVRPAATPAFRELLSDEVIPSSSADIEVCLHLAYSRSGAAGNQAVEVNLGHPRLTLLPDAFLALNSFFVQPYYQVFAQHLMIRKVKSIVVAADHDLPSSLMLTPTPPCTSPPSTSTSSRSGARATRSASCASAATPAP